MFAPPTRAKRLQWKTAFSRKWAWRLKLGLNYCFFLSTSLIYCMKKCCSKIIACKPFGHVFNICHCFTSTHPYMDAMQGVTSTCKVGDKDAVGRGAQVFQGPTLPPCCSSLGPMHAPHDRVGCGVALWRPSQHRRILRPIATGPRYFGLRPHEHHRRPPADVHIGPHRTRPLWEGLEGRSSTVPFWLPTTAFLARQSVDGMQGWHRPEIFLQWEELVFIRERKNLCFFSLIWRAVTINFPPGCHMPAVGIFDAFQEGLAACQALPRCSPRAKKTEIGRLSRHRGHRSNCRPVTWW